MENNNINTANSEPVVWPTNTEQTKKKEKLKVVYLVLAILLTIGSALGSFYLSQNLNQASTPNAPSSKPEAKWSPKGEGAGSNQKTENTEKNNCKQGCGSNEYCDDGRCKKTGGVDDPRTEWEQIVQSNPTIAPTQAGAEYSCTPQNCPGPCFGCNASRTSCISNGCPGVSSVGISGYLTATIAPPKVIPSPALCEKLKSDTGCSLADCHCTGGDACTTVECGIKGSIDLRTSCANQGRSWCVNMTGKGMTCCEAGYSCHSSGKGCEGSGSNLQETPSTEITTTVTIPPTTTVTAPPTITTTVTVPPTITTTIPPTITATPTGTVTVTVTPTIAVCNETCEIDEDCSDGLFCDSDTNKCRKEECSSETSCVCPTETPEPTIVDCNYKCKTDDNCSSGLICDSDSGRCRKAACSDEKDCSCPKPRKTDAPTREVTTRRTATRTAAQPTVLKEAGILDFPGAAVFGSGLILTVIGILLAL